MTTRLAIWVALLCLMIPLSELEDGLKTRILLPVLIPPQVRKPETKNRPAQKMVKFSKNYLPMWIESKLKNYIPTLQQCIFKDLGFNYSEMKMTLHWNSNGKFSKVSFEPPVDTSALQCSQQLLNFFEIQLHQGGKPIRYSVTLRL